MNTISSIASIGIGATVGASCRYYIGILSMHYLGKALAQRDISINAIGWINWFIDDNVCSFNRVG